MITVNFDKLEIKPNFKILDIGCGPGRHTAAAFRFKDAFVVGADLNLADLQKAKARLKFHQFCGEFDGGKWELTTSDITSLPFDDNTFDLVICSEVMEHIPDDKAAAKELIRVLKPNRNMVVSVPRYWPEKICWLLADDYFDANQGHIRIYTKKEIIKLLESSGSQLWHSHYAHSIHSPYWWLKCLTGPTRSDVSAVNMYERFLSWDILEEPPLTKFVDKLLNPVLGKSLVLYMQKR